MLFMASRMMGATYWAIWESNRRLYIWKMTGAPVSSAACITPITVSRLYTLKAGTAKPFSSPMSRIFFRS